MGLKNRYWIFGSILLCLFFFISCAGKSASFKSTTTYDGNPVELRGSLNKPKGDGPFPAVVLLHGCSGIMDTRQNFWVKKLNAMGYATIQVDSLAPRKIYSLVLCQGDGTVPGLDFSVRARDAFDARSHLQSLDFIDSDKIAVMGFSHGAISALVASKASNFDQSPFSAVISLYPHCFEGAFSEYESPVLVIIGEDDDWTPAKLCKKEFAERDKEGRHDVTLEVLPELTHCFDCPGIRDYQGHRMEFSKEGRQKALQLVSRFLHQHTR